jgi:hypothetical protein
LLPDASEDQIRNEIVRFYRKVEWGVIDTEQGYRPDGSTRVTRGLADLIVFAAGYHCFIEVKSATGTQTDHQKWFEGLCRLAHVDYHIMRDVSQAAALYREITERGRP